MGRSFMLFLVLSIVYVWYYVGVYVFVSFMLVILRSVNEDKTNFVLTIICIDFWFISLVTQGCHNPVSFSIPSLLFPLS